MANNYGDPNSWKPVKSKPTEAFTRPGQAASGLAQSKAKKRFEGLTPQSRDPYYESGKALFNMGVVEPIKSMGRTVTGKNAAVYANPFNDASLKDRAIKLGEDVLNVAALYPGVKAATSASRAALADSYFMGETFLHGSPYRGLTEIKPFSNSARFPGHTVSYGMNPNPSSGLPINKIIDRAANYAQGGMGSKAGESFLGQEGGSIYVAKARQGDIIRNIPSVPGTPSNYGSGTMIPGHIHGGEATLSGAPSKIISEIPFSNKEEINRRVLEALSPKSRVEKLAKKLATKFIGDYKVPTRPHKYIPPRPPEK